MRMGSSVNPAPHDHAHHGNAKPCSELATALAEAARRGTEATQ